MAIRILLLPIFLIAILQFCGCDPPEGPTYKFSIESTVFPSINDTINVGDTLYFISTFPSKLEDQTSGKVIDYSNAVGLGGTLGFADFLKLKTNSTQDSTTTKDFEYVKIQGDVYNDKSAPVYWSVNQTRYEEKNGYYYLKVGMIPKKKGQFLFSVSDLYCNGQVGKKNSANFILRLVDTDQHLHYFEDQFGPLSDHDKGHVYCFVVK